MERWRNEGKMEGQARVVEVGLETKVQPAVLRAKAEQETPRWS